MQSNARVVRVALSALVGLALTGPGLAPATYAALNLGPASGTGAAVVTAVEGPPVGSVVAVSIDALQSRAIRVLGPGRAPTLHRLMKQGASTLNARTAYEQTNTLPNHTSMVTSRRIDARLGGHGVTWNDGRLDPATVHQAAGKQVESVFSTVDAAGGSTALFGAKTKFRLFKRSWPDSFDRFAIRQSNGRLVRLLRADLRDHTRAFRFVHLSLPDVAGHEYGFRSAKYLQAVERSDALLGRIVATIKNRGLADEMVLLVTADHGGTRFDHSDPTKLENYRVPFLAWGVGVARGADLYALNDDYANPGHARTTYATTRPPVRNGAVANLATDLLQIGPVAGSEIDAEQDLDLR